MTRQFLTGSLALLIGVILMGNIGWAAEVDFRKQIQPIFKERCYDCHGPEKQESGLRLDRKEDALAGGNSGKVILAGEAEESLLIKYVRGDDPELTMPPDGENLSRKQIELLKKWINDGAAWPDDKPSSQSP